VIIIFSQNIFLHQSNKTRGNSIQMILI